jgi:hypothetical protein
VATQRAGVGPGTGTGSVRRALQAGPDRAYHLGVSSVDPLDAIKIASPCTVAWSSLVGDERVRHCGQCCKNVYNVAAMTREEALSLIEGKERRICMRLTYRADGTIATGNCRARLRAARRRGMFAFGGMLVVMLAAEVWAQAFGLRALTVLFGGESSSPLQVAAPAEELLQEAQEASLVHVRVPYRKSSGKYAKRVSMGDVPLDGL